MVLLVSFRYIEEPLRKMEEYEGLRILLETENGRYEGIINYADKISHRITLQEVVETTTNSRYTTLLHFQGDEIKNLTILDDVEPQKNAVGRIKANAKLMHKKFVPGHLKNFEQVDLDSLLLKESGISSDTADGQSQRQGRDHLLSSDHIAQAQSLFSSSALRTSLETKDKCEIVDEMSKKFYHWVDVISKSAVVGVALEGPNMGREGTLAWLSVAANGDVILFDIFTLGASAFEEGLRDFLESELILKVIHDCRSASDILFHQYNVKLQRVFDTQVMNSFVYRLTHGGDWPRHVQALGPCLIEHLGLSKEEVHIMIVRENQRESDEKAWLKRPAPSSTLTAAVKHVVHLLTLRAALIELFHLEFYTAVEMSLSFIRDASGDHAKRWNKNGHLLPPFFQEIGSMLHVPKHLHFSKNVDQNGFQNNPVSIHIPGVVASRDSIWHRDSRERTYGQVRRSEPASHSGSRRSWSARNDRKSHPSGARILKVAENQQPADSVARNSIESEESLSSQRSALQLCSNNSQGLSQFEGESHAPCLPGNGSAPKEPLYYNPHSREHWNLQGEQIGDCSVPLCSCPVPASKSASQTKHSLSPRKEDCGLPVNLSSDSIASDIATPSTSSTLLAHLVRKVNKYSSEDLDGAYNIIPAGQMIPNAKKKQGKYRGNSSGDCDPSSFRNCRKENQAVPPTSSVSAESAAPLPFSSTNCCSASTQQQQEQSQPYANFLRLISQANSQTV